MGTLLSPLGLRRGVPTSINADQAGGLFWLGVSVVVCAIALKDGLGTLHVPGPGFFPFLGSAVLGTFSILLVVDGSLRKKRGGETITWHGRGWRKVAALLAGLFLYCLLLPLVGYSIATFLLMTFALSLMGGWRLRANVLVGAFTALASYMMFHVLLEMQLPRGVLGW